jgi:hypothetical protein
LVSFCNGRCQGVLFCMKSSWSSLPHSPESPRHPRRSVTVPLDHVRSFEKVSSLAPEVANRIVGCRPRRRVENRPFESTHVVLFATRIGDDASAVLRVAGPESVLEAQSPRDASDGEVDVDTPLVRVGQRDGAGPRAPSDVEFDPDAIQSRHGEESIGRWAVLEGEIAPSVGSRGISTAPCNMIRPGLRRSHL